jgi:hypothetical protein
VIPLFVALLPEPDLAWLEDQATSDVVPMGCWDVVGTVVWDNRTMGMADGGTAQISGRLEDGAWTEIQASDVVDANPNVSMELQVDAGRLPFAPPLFGSLESAEDGLGNVLHFVMGQASGEEGVLLARADTLDDQDVYVLERSFTARGVGGAVEQQVWIEPGGQARTWQTQVRNARLHDGGRITRMDAVLELDAQGRPVQETLAAVFRMGPLAMRVKQQVTYDSVTPCQASTLH